MEEAMGCVVDGLVGGWVGAGEEKRSWEDVWLGGGGAGWVRRSRSLGM